MTRPSGCVTYDNRDRIVLVSGGSSGIGETVCSEFLHSGAVVISADLVAPLGKAPAERFHFQCCDTSSEEACQQLIHWIIETFGALDVLVNNAAIQPQASYTPVHEMDSDLAKRMVDINFFGYTFLAKYAIRPMLAQHSGVIVNIASGQGHRTARQVPIYGPMKAATLLQTMQWGIEYAREGIRVVSVSPGAIDTPLVRASLEAQGGGEALANRHPLGRLGQPEEVARAVLWLASDDAAFVTATDLAVDGGLAAYGAFADPYPTPARSNRNE